MKKLITLALLGLGCWYITTSGYMLAKAHLSQFLIADAWQKTLEDKKHHKPWSWADTYPIFEIKIPRINKGSYILEGASGRNMAFSAAHTSISGLPGQNKSTIISGHRDSHFDYLQELKLGDEIVTYGQSKNLKFKVIELRVINSRLEKLAIKNKNELILTTCYPFNSLQTGGDLRFVVHAIPI
jgi:sortase A